MAEPETQPKPVEIFFSYAHKDEGLRDQLEKHLSVLKRQGVVSGWHDRQIRAGGDWAREVSLHLETARVILLLVSPDFVASDYCYGVEMRRALERHAGGEAVVVPVILRPVDWQGAEFGGLQALPRDAKPVTLWRSRDEAFLSVAEGIRAAVAGSGTPTPGDSSSDAAVPAGRPCERPGIQRPARGDEDDPPAAGREEANAACGRVENVVSPGDPVGWLDPAAKIGPYLPLRLISNGAMSKVFLARNARAAENVVIKVYDVTGVPRRRVTAFLSGVRDATLVSHPAIVALRDAGWCGDHSSYVVRDFVYGVESLAMAKWSRRFSPEEACGLVAEVCDGLDLAHAKGVFHNDLSPSYILVDAAARPHVIGLGEDVDRLDRSSLIGTKLYAAPERYSRFIRRGRAPA
jgi:hypothetical protein